MRRLMILATVAVLAIGAIGTTSAHNDQSGHKQSKASLGGFAEVPSISTTGSGKLAISLDNAGTTLTYTLTWKDLQGGSASAAHLHLGQPGVAGGVIADLCGGTKPACPAGAAGTVTGTIVAGNILGPAGQGIGAGEFAEVLRAIRAGAVYANVHNGIYGGGEIRGQLRGGWGD